jgi:hypothetical protein
LITASQCISEFTPLRSPIASSNSLDHCLSSLDRHFQVHLELLSTTACSQSRYSLDRNWFPDHTVRTCNHHDLTPKQTTRVSPFNKVFSSSKYNFLSKQIVNYIKCGFVNTATPPKSTPSSYHTTPSPCTTTHPTPLQLMELNKTIPFIIETQWPVTLGASPASFWWRFRIF